MSDFHGKQIILGISGGIAAYKAALIVRLLIKQGAIVQVIMTQSATEFISPLTLQALSGRAVRTDLFDTTAEAAMSHIELARWADYILIAPASANVLARLATGFANDLLTTVCLTTASPIAVAPAMNRLMWCNPATQDNVQRLHSRKIIILGPASGSQACGEVGLGRLLEPDALIEQWQKALPQDSKTDQALHKKRILITAGPTQEAIDPVRYLSNHSSGKMGYAIAKAARDAGAEVRLVSGPVHLATPDDVKRFPVTSAQEMHNAVQKQAAVADILIATAAVADYTPVEVMPQKIKKQADQTDEQLTLRLKRNPDILAEASRCFPHLFCVGFAAETENVIAYARRKLKQKKLAMIAANHVGNGKAFGQDDNALEVIWQDGQVSLPMMDKQQLAQRLIEIIAERYQLGCLTQ